MSNNLSFNFNLLPSFVKWQLTLPGGQKLFGTYSPVCPRCNQGMQSVGVDCIPYGLQPTFYITLFYCPCSESDFVLPMELMDAFRSFF